MDILCVGHAAWDVSALVEEYPLENSKGVTRELLECGGGPAANAACLLASWGASCALATSVGRDVYADRVIEELMRAGVDVTLVHRSADPTPVSLILVNARTASRTIVNRRAEVAADPCQILTRPDWPEPPSVLLFDGHELAASLDAMRLFPDARTILDAGSVRPGTVELARRVDQVVASERFARQFSGVDKLESEQQQATALHALFQHNGRPVVITLGERGVLYGTGEHFEKLEAFRVKSIDTTGAGDVFHGAFAYGLWKRLPLEDTLRLASAAAALSTTRRGGRPSLPTLAQVQELLDGRHF